MLGVRPRHMLKILVTGASGAVGYAVSHGLKARGHAVRGFDRQAAREPGEHLVGDLLDAEALAAAVQGRDIVVHCAAVPERQDFVRELVPNNIVGTYNVLEAARLGGVRRVIYVSSIRVVGALSWENGCIGLDAGLVPRDHYGLSKATGEMMAQMYASRFGLEVISARLGWFVRNTDEARMFERLSSASRMYLSHRDAQDFFVRAVELPNVSYAAVFVTSHNRGDSAFDLKPAERLCGYTPKDSFPEGSSWPEHLRFASPTVGPSLLPVADGRPGSVQK